MTDTDDVNPVVFESTIHIFEVGDAQARCPIAISDRQILLDVRVIGDGDDFDARMILVEGDEARLVAVFTEAHQQNSVSLEIGQRRISFFEEDGRPAFRIDAGRRWLPAGQIAHDLVQIGLQTLLFRFQIANAVFAFFKRSGKILHGFFQFSRFLS